MARNLSIRPLGPRRNGHLWLDRRITIDLVLIHSITGLSMQGPKPQDFYPRKFADHTLAQMIKETYDDV
jgi:hypothetical protein